MPKYKQLKRPGSSHGSVKILGMDVDQLTKNLEIDFNNHIEILNNSNKINNIIQGVGYILASLTAFFSMYLSIIN